MESKKEIERLQEIDKVRPSSYTLNKINKRKRIVEEQKVSAKNTLIEALEFYNENYPKSSYDLDWTKIKVNFKVNEDIDYDDFLERLTEEELYNAREILIYSLKEQFKGNIKARDRYNLAIVRIRKKIPGIKYVEKLEAIKEKEHQILKERKKFEILIQEERKKFEEAKLKSTIKIIEPIIEPIKPEINEELEPYICSECNHTHVKGDIYLKHLQFKVV